MRNRSRLITDELKKFWKGLSTTRIWEVQDVMLVTWLPGAPGFPLCEHAGVIPQSARVWTGSFESPECWGLSSQLFSAAPVLRENQQAVIAASLGESSPKAR